MIDSKIERDSIEISSEGTMSSASTGIMALLPIVAASTFGNNTLQIVTHSYGLEKSETSLELSVEERPSSKLQISQGVGITENSLDNQSLSLDKETNYEYSDIEEFEILESFINDILNSSQQQPGSLKSLMYDNIDDLLI